MKRNNIIEKKTSAFTLVEVMVVLAIVSLIIPSILFTFSFFNQAAADGIEKNINLTQVRFFNQFFREEVNRAKGSTLLVSDSGRQLSIDRYAPNGAIWQNAVFQYSSANQELSYSCAGSSRSLLRKTTPLAGGTTHVFSITNGVVYCRFLVGESGNQSVELEISAAPRNP